MLIATQSKVFLLPGEPLQLLIGTEGPYLYRYKDCAVERDESFDRLEYREAWYTPWGGPRGAPGAVLERTLYRSEDSGTRWEAIWEAAGEIQMINCAGA